MRNQTSFRLTTTLLPTDMTAKTTTVINKVDSNGDKFYPTFTEETIVLTNDDRTVMETTRATCNEGVLTFTVRGLPDNGDLTPVDNRKLTWNPGSLCFITAGASDWIDKDDNITWTGNQTYTGNLVSTGNATYNGLLTTNKGVKYPNFASVADLEAYTAPFAGMFATVDSTGELYRYNAVTEEWSVVTTSEPTNPEMASTTTIGTVRGATNAEFAAGTSTGSQGELLVATPSQILGVSPEVKVDVFTLTALSDLETAQAIFDSAMSGGCPIIRLETSQGLPNFFYLRGWNSSRLIFYSPQFVTGTDTQGKYLGKDYVRINYSGQAVTSVLTGVGSKLYFEYEEEE